MLIAMFYSDWQVYNISLFCDCGFHLRSGIIPDSLGRELWPDTEEDKADFSGIQNFVNLLHICCCQDDAESPRLVHYMVLTCTGGDIITELCTLLYWTGLCTSLYCILKCTLYFTILYTALYFVLHCTLHFTVLFT